MYPNASVWLKFVKFKINNNDNNNNDNIKMNGMEHWKLTSTWSFILTSPEISGRRGSKDEFEYYYKVKIIHILNSSLRRNAVLVPKPFRRISGFKT